MSKRGHYLGGHTVINGPAPSSKKRKTFVGALENLKAYNSSPGPVPKPPKKKKSKSPADKSK